jgi:taurine dioxygenase
MSQRPLAEPPFAPSASVEEKRCSYRTVTARPISGALGAVICDIDLREDLSPTAVADLRQALLDHCVIFFRGQDISAADQKRVAQYFGNLFLHPNFAGRADDPAVIDIVREPDDTMVVGQQWHSDTTMMTAPPLGSVLYAVEMPPYGGDTMFANQYMAHDALSDGMRRLLDGVLAVHSDRNSAGPNNRRNAHRSTKVRSDGEWQETCNLHPVLRTHPETGRKALFVNEATTVGLADMTEEESQPLLRYLFDHGHRPEFTCRFHWEPGSVAVWDNRCVKHIALNDTHGFRRVMRRVQIAGDKPF